MKFPTLKQMRKFAKAQFNTVQYTPDFHARLQKSFGRSTPLTPDELYRLTDLYWQAVDPEYDGDPCLEDGGPWEEGTESNSETSAKP
jgi:hypothetical protein